MDRREGGAKRKLDKETRMGWWGSCWVVLAPGQRGVFIHPAPNYDGGRPGEER